MVRLHMLHNQVVGSLVAEDPLDVRLPGLEEARIDGVHHRGLLSTENHIAVVRHAQRNDILPLEKVNVVVVHANILDGIRDVLLNLHFLLPLLNPCT